MVFETSKELGEIIKKNRKKQKMTQAQLALFSGVGARFIVDIEAGKPNCRIEKVLNVAKKLGIKFEAIING